MTDRLITMPAYDHLDVQPYSDPSKMGCTCGWIGNVNVLSDHVSAFEEYVAHLDEVSDAEDAEVGHAQWCEAQPPHSYADCPDNAEVGA